MRILDRHILLEWLKTLAMTLAALAALLLVARMFAELPNFLEWDAPPALTAGYFALQAPSYLPVVLPVALLIATLFSLGVLRRNQELTAMRAAGLGIPRITRPLWLAGGVFSLLLFALNATIVPWAAETANALAETAEFSHLARRAGETAAAAAKAPAKNAAGTAAGDDAGAAAIPDAKAAPRFFANAAANRVWSIDRLSAHLGVGYGARVFQNNAAGEPVTAWFAREARYDAKRRRWTLLDGRRLEFAPDGRLLAQPRFERAEPPELTEPPRLMVSLNKKPRDLSIREIRDALAHAGDASSPKAAALAVQYHSILATPFCCLIVIGLAVPFAVGGGRVNPMVGVSKSLVLFALYYLVSTVCALLGAQGRLPPALAAWLPNLAALAPAVWLCARVN